MGKWFSQRESAAAIDVEQSQADYNKEITPIRFDLIVLYAKGIPFSTSSDRR